MAPRIGLAGCLAGLMLASAQTPAVAESKDSPVLRLAIENDIREEMEAIRAKIAVSKEHAELLRQKIAVEQQGKIEAAAEAKQQKEQAAALFKQQKAAEHQRQVEAAAAEAKRKKDLAEARQRRVAEQKRQAEAAADSRYVLLAPESPKDPTKPSLVLDSLSEQEIKQAEQDAKQALAYANKALTEAKATLGKPQDPIRPKLLWQTLDQPTEFALADSSIKRAAIGLAGTPDGSAKKAAEKRLDAAKTQLASAEKILKQAKDLVDPAKQAQRAAADEKLKAQETEKALAGNLEALDANNLANQAKSYAFQVPTKDTLEGKKNAAKTASDFLKQAEAALTKAQTDMDATKWEILPKEFKQSDARKALATAQQTFNEAKAMLKALPADVAPAQAQPTPETAAAEAIPTPTPADPTAAKSHAEQAAALVKQAEVKAREAHDQDSEMEKAKGLGVANTTLAEAASELNLARQAIQTLPVGPERKAVENAIKDADKAITEARNTIERARKAPQPSAGLLSWLRISLVLIFGVFGSIGIWWLLWRNQHQRKNDLSDRQPPVFPPFVWLDKLSAILASRKIPAEPDQSVANPEALFTREEFERMKQQVAIQTKAARRKLPQPAPVNPLTLETPKQPQPPADQLPTLEYTSSTQAGDAKGQASSEPKANATAPAPVKPPEPPPKPRPVLASKETEPERYQQQIDDIIKTIREEINQAIKARMTAKDLCDNIDAKLKDRFNGKPGDVEALDSTLETQVEHHVWDYLLFLEPDAEDGISRQGLLFVAPGIPLSAKMTEYFDGGFLSEHIVKNETPAQVARRTDAKCLLVNTKGIIVTATAPQPWLYYGRIDAITDTILPEIRQGSENRIMAQHLSDTVHAKLEARFSEKVGDCYVYDNALKVEVAHQGWYFLLFLQAGVEAGLRKQGLLFVAPGVRHTLKVAEYFDGGIGSEPIVKINTPAKVEMNMLNSRLILLEKGNIETDERRKA